ncbi:MAG: hypothetical protein B6244_12310 [Candidatus Cloacimonetes bacterium 4572_55]|nr:MAG: hypothetical protein B6244_12310 [Candidatus Cloacimonetes bacterium 4572_55]
MATDFIKNSVTRYRYLQSYLRPHYPIYLVHFVTARCPYRCPTCFYWKQSDQADPTHELSAEEIAILARRHPYPWQVTITGGEPFVRRDLDQILTAYLNQSKPLGLSIHTTGSFPNRTVDAIERVLSRADSRKNKTKLTVHFSLDMIGKSYDRFCGVTSAFDRMNETYRGLKQLQREYESIFLTVDTVYSSANQDALSQVHDYISEQLEPDRKNLILVRGTTRDPLVRKIDVQQYREWAAHWQSDRTGDRNYTDRLKSEMARAVSDQIENIMRGKATSCHCAAGDKFVVINERGDVLPCEMTHLIPGATYMGNLRERDLTLSRLLCSPQADKIRRAIREGSCACTYECALFASILTTPTEMAKRALLASVNRNTNNR